MGVIDGIAGTVREFNMTVYVFDMDGTLTPPRLAMTADFAARFHAWQTSHLNFIATGSDYAKVQEQLPSHVINAFTGIYCSMGNLLKAQEKIVYQNTFQADPALFEKLEFYRQHTTYPGPLFPNYIEPRIGMVNFSVLGRDCPYAEREKYTAWDKTTHEREQIKEELSRLFPQYDIAVGGSISMDITPKGRGKGQIATHLRHSYPKEKIIFFGDKTFSGGNDYELACALRQLPNTQVVQVTHPQEVLNYLEHTNGQLL